MPFGSMNMLFILQILHFYFFPLLVLLFCPLAQFSCGFWALAHSSFNISMRFFWGMTLVCMRRRKKRPKQALFRQNAKKNIIFFVFRLTSTKLKLGLHIYIGQVKFDFELIQKKKKMCFFVVDPNWRKFDWNFSHISFFYNFFKMLILRHQYNSTNI